MMDCGVAELATAEGWRTRLPNGEYILTSRTAILLPSSETNGSLSNPSRVAFHLGVSVGLGALALTARCEGVERGDDRLSPVINFPHHLASYLPARCWRSLGGK